MLQISRPKKKTNGRLTNAARVIMSQHLGRELLPTECVHHKDENYLNDSIENLELMSISNHK